VRREGPHVLVLSNVHYVHARARYILLSHDSQALSRVWRKSRFLEHSIGKLGGKNIFGNTSQSISKVPQKGQD